MVARMSASFIPFVMVCLFLVWANEAIGQTTTFNYQGRLQDGGASANGNYDFQFTLWDSLSGGTQQPAAGPITVNRPSVSVAGGIFAVQLDFGINALPGADRFLEISVRPAGGPSFTTLSPRQQISSTPYSIRTLSATTADALSSACVACVQDSQINAVAGSKVNGVIPVASVPDISANYIRNSTAQQAASNFNVSGDGTAGGTLTGNQVTGNVVNATAQYNLNGNRAFSVSGVGTFVDSNTFVGIGAGTDTTPNFAGFGSENSFYGGSAGRKNTTGDSNSFFGRSAGENNTISNSNSFFGGSAGANNTIGNSNSFFGKSAGGSNMTGGGNSFFGTNAGATNTTGSENTMLGWTANVGSNNLTNAAAIGAYARVDADNALVLGSIKGVNGAPADTRVGIGITAPAFKLHVVDPGNVGLRVQTNTAGGTVASFGPLGAFEIDSNGTAGGRLTVEENGNVGIGVNNQSFRLQVFNQGAKGLRVATNTAGGTLASFGGLGTFQIDANGLEKGRFVVEEGGNVGIGTPAPNDKLEVNGVLRVDSLGTIGGTQLCRNLSNQIANCSSSLRYKTNIAPFSSGLSFLKQLRPITFDWKQGGMRDVGFGAEDVAKVDPLFVTYNDKGQVEGVKYDRLSAAFVNAFREQQKEIESQQKLIESQQQQIDALKKLVCSTNPGAEICKRKN